MAAVHICSLDVTVRIDSALFFLRVQVLVRSPKTLPMTSPAFTVWLIALFLRTIEIRSRLEEEW